MLPADEARAIAARFRINKPIEIEPFKGRGNINLETYLVTSGHMAVPFLLQKVNSNVFPMPDRVMAGMVASLEAQKAALDCGVAEGEGWQVPELVPTTSGDLYLSENGTWRMMRYIEGTVSYKSLSELPAARRLEAAKEVGRGLAIYSDLTTSIDAITVPTALPGYRNTRLYFDLLDSALAGHREPHHVEPLLPTEPEVREASERHFYCALPEEERLRRLNDPDIQRFIGLALEHRDLALSMQDARENGTIRHTAIHGDTKIENFLFDAQTGRVVSLVDLDTVMPHTWLADWGDMVRSLANVAGEKERNLDLVQVDREVYAAVAEGFLNAVSSATEEEIELMPRAVQVIALELGIRFLADYLRGDTYFQIGDGDPEDLNKVRAMVQIQLFERLLEHEAEAKGLVMLHSSVGAA